MEPYSGFGFVLSDSEVGELIKMSQIAGERVSVNLECKIQLDSAWGFRIIKLTFVNHSHLRVSACPVPTYLL